MSYTDYDFPHSHMYDSDLREILARLKKLEPTVDALVEWKEDFTDEYNKFKQFIADIESGNLPDSFIDAINAWMEKNAINIVGEMIKTVHFGLTNDGYFCAYIPSSWENIQFDTVNDYSDPLYGHLMLLYD